MDRNRTTPRTRVVSASEAASQSKHFRNPTFRIPHFLCIVRLSLFFGRCWKFESVSEPTWTRRLSLRSPWEQCIWLQRGSLAPICHPNIVKCQFTDIATPSFSTSGWHSSSSLLTNLFSLFRSSCCTFRYSSPLRIVIMSARSLVSSSLFRAVSARNATSSTLRASAAPLASLRAFSSSIPKSSGRVAIQGDGKGDRVNPNSPFSESAGVNPVDHYKDVIGPLHDFGSYITSCKFSPSFQPDSIIFAASRFRGHADEFLFYPCQSLYECTNHPTIHLLTLSHRQVSPSSSSNSASSRTSSHSTLHQTPSSPH